MTVQYYSPKRVANQAKSRIKKILGLLNEISLLYNEEDECIVGYCGQAIDSVKEIEITITETIEAGLL
ncbi:MAG: hypothetical protein AB7U85_04800 [Alphaproteobacteria bacterium]